MRTEEVLTSTTGRWVTEVAQLYPIQSRWTEADYFALPDTNRLIELAEGTLTILPHPTNTQQRVVGKLFKLIDSFVEANDLGIIRFAPLPVRLWQDVIREPDILFVSHEHPDRIGEQSFGPPALAVEVISPSTRRTDRRDKFDEYARAGIGEYWIVDPEAVTIEVFALEGGAYTLLVKAGPGEKAFSRLLAGVQVLVDEVFAK
jgi:Uma2 family endonuclease